MAELLRHIKTLSTELHLMILSQTGPCTALSTLTVLLETLSLLEANYRSDQCPCQLVRFSNKVYVKYATIRGRSYISEISNRWHASMKEILCPLQPVQMLLSLDDLGVQDILFIVKGSTRSGPVQAPWYQHNELGNADRMLLVTKNVQKRTRFI